VKEIVIGLNGREYASSLYTIDEELRIVGHAKYSGPLCVEFLKLVKKLSGDANETDSFGGSEATRRSFARSVRNCFGTSGRCNALLSSWEFAFFPLIMNQEFKSPFVRAGRHPPTTRVTDSNTLLLFGKS
jgi:hypothetical protein